MIIDRKELLMLLKEYINLKKGIVAFEKDIFYLYLPNYSLIKRFDRSNIIYFSINNEEINKKVEYFNMKKVNLNFTLNEKIKKLCKLLESSDIETRNFGVNLIIKELGNE